MGNRMTAEVSIETGVYYRMHDYAGFGRRFIVTVVDLLICLLLLILLSTIWVLLFTPDPETWNLLGLGLVALSHTSFSALPCPSSRSKGDVTHKVCRLVCCSIRGADC
jgi:hypothetical protein